MRALMLCAFAAAAFGCGVPESATEGSAASPIISPIRPTPPPPNCANETIFFPQTPAANDDPWQGHAPGFVLDTPHSSAFTSGFVVFGFDATLTTLVWSRSVPDQAGVDFYRSLPETRPFTCPLVVEVGQVGGAEVPTGSGGSVPGVYVCPLASDLATLKDSCICEPNPDPCGAAVCGSASDGCGHTVDCGSCQDATICSFGRCVSPHVPPPPVCHGACI
jgi:hypothetical protein